MRRGLSKPRIARDLWIIILSLAFALVIARYDIADRIFAFIGFVPLEAFSAGFFFTSLLTLAPAAVVLASLAESAPLMELALYGALGALLGDLLLFLFVRDVVSEDVLALLRGSWSRKINILFHKSPYLSWAIPVAGALIIASPLPDEVGLALLGLSKADIRFMIPVSFLMNFIGIWLIGYAAGAQ